MDSGTRTIERALEILECFDEEHSELGISEIAKKVDLSKATTYRIIKTLGNKGYMLQDPISQKYRIGMGFLKLGKLFLAHLDFRRVAIPYMYKIRDELNESVNLFISNGKRRVCIERIESKQPLRRVLKIGDEFPLDKGAAGKVLLAFGAGDSFMVNEEELSMIREQGYAVSHGERAGDASSVAAPIFNHDGKIVAAVAISGATMHYQEPALQNYIDVVTNNAKNISENLGY